MVSRSRCRLAQIERADLVGAEDDIEAAILVGRTQCNTVIAEGAAELERAVAEAQPAVTVDPPDDRPGAIVDGAIFSGKPRPLGR
jgi:hypothetical protein